MQYDLNSSSSRRHGRSLLIVRGKGTGARGQVYAAKEEGGVGAARPPTTGPSNLACLTVSGSKQPMPYCRRTLHRLVIARRAELGGCSCC